MGQPVTCPAPPASERHPPLPAGHIAHQTKLLGQESAACQVSGHGNKAVGRQHTSSGPGPRSPPPCEGSEACIRNLVLVEIKLLHMAHQTKCSESGECTCQVSRHGNKAVGRQHTVKWSKAPFNPLGPGVIAICCKG